MASLPPIPANILQYIKQAASGTGLPENVVAAQNYVESSYGSNIGPSSTGAMGPWQFEPYTWPSYSSLPFSDATNWADSTQAYTNFMKSLLKQENGNVRNALAAYNAGSGNLSAGYGYADEILSLAGQSQSVTAGASTTTGGSSTLGGLFSIPGEITSFFSDADKFVNDVLGKLVWLVMPSSWVRIGAFFAGMLLLIGAVIVFTKADTKINPTIPIPVPV